METPIIVILVLVVIILGKLFYNTKIKLKETEKTFLTTTQELGRNSILKDTEFLEPRDQYVSKAKHSKKLYDKLQEIEFLLLDIDHLDPKAILDKIQHIKENGVDNFANEGLRINQILHLLLKFYLLHYEKFLRDLLANNGSFTDLYSFNISPLLPHYENEMKDVYYIRENIVHKKIRSLNDYDGLVFFKKSLIPYDLNSYTITEILNKIDVVTTDDLENLNKHFQEDILPEVKLAVIERFVLLSQRPEIGDSYKLDFDKQAKKLIKDLQGKLDINTPTHTAITLKLAKIHAEIVGRNTN